MISEATVSVILLLLFPPLFLALSWVYSDSRRQLIRAREELVVNGLAREREQGELEISRDSFLKRLEAVRNTENLIYGRLPDSSNPEKLKAIVSASQAKQYLDSFLGYSEGVEQRADEKLEELERYLEEKRARILAQNRRFRAADRIFAVTSAIVRVWIGAAVLVVIGNVLFGLF